MYPDVFICHVSYGAFCRTSRMLFYGVAFKSRRGTLKNASQKFLFNFWEADYRLFLIVLFFMFGFTAFHDFTGHENKEYHHQQYQR